MDSFSWGVIGDRPLAAAIVVDGASTVGEARERVVGGAWLVVADASGFPMSAVAPGALDAMPPDRPLVDVLAGLPPTVVAQAATPVRGFVGSWVVEEIEPESAVVAVAGGAVAGVWAGRDLRAAVALADDRVTFGDTELPGEIAIPLLSRACRYREVTAGCGVVRVFPERPVDLPWCANPAGLAAHRFGW